MAKYKDHEHYGNCEYCKHVDNPRSVLSPCFACSLRGVFREGEWHEKWEPAEQSQPEPKYCQDCAYYNIINGCMPCKECKGSNLYVPKTEPIGPYYHYEKDLEKVTKEAWKRHLVRLAMLKGEANELTKQLEEMHEAHKKHVAEMQDKYRKTWAIDARFKKNEAWWHADISEEPSWGKSVTQTKKLHGAGELIIMPVAYFVDQITMDEDTKEVEITFEDGTCVSVSMPKKEQEDDV